MAGVAYTPAVRAEAVAFAEQEGARAAGARFNIDWRTVRRWAERVGADLTPDSDPDELTEVRHRRKLAGATLTRELQEGRHHGVSLATIEAIQRRQERELEKRPGRLSEPAAVDARELFLDWLVPELPEADLADLDAADRAIGTLLRALMRAANAEPDQPHRTAMLSWHSGRRAWGDEAIVAGDVLAWAQGLTSARMAAHDGSLVAWAAAEEARVKAERDARWAPVPHRLDPDLAALIAEVDQLLLDWS